ncbi:hypothetical protein BDZ91DRAFT_119390 [Kalaharituber pfeilii]|nr:hypothetical protein BDZ91DRAFT_119390 [Kalaharituber pfeilii]
MPEPGRSSEGRRPCPYVTIVCIAQAIVCTLLSPGPHSALSKYQINGAPDVNVRFMPSRTCCGRAGRTNHLVWPAISKNPVCSRVRSPILQCQHTGLMLTVFPSNRVESVRSWQRTLGCPWHQGPKMARIRSSLRSCAR